ncbi:hypothetical protein J522_1936 [Acinetobacter baumannii 146457]|nr:hypothetical protein J522_1936 [Acinetobacter baumannii 146457]
MDNINFTRPIDEQPNNHAGLETAMARALKKVFAEVFQDQLQNILDYGAPHIGSPEVIERFSKQDGLVVLRRPVSSDKLMRVIYANWSSMASERGLGFLEFVMRMLWSDQWQIKRMWHPVSSYQSYPQYIIDEERPNHFLTSRIRITIDETVDLSEIVELSPILRRLVPANIVVKVNAKELDVNGEFPIGVGLVSKTYMVDDQSVGILDNKPTNETPLQEFDFAVIRYIWDSNGGEDLDTRTRVINPARNTDVGWGRASVDGEYLHWNGDNTGSGVESVLLNLNALTNDYADQVFQIALRSYWFRTKVTGDFKIQFESYKGGTMQPNGFDFINTGGVLVQSITLNTNVQMQNNSNVDGEDVAVLTYNSVAKVGRLNLV